MNFGIILVLLLYVSVLIFVECLRLCKCPSLLTRKLAHVGGAIVSIFLPFFVSRIEAIGIGVFFSLLLLVLTLMGKLKSIGTKDDILGSVFFPLGLAAAVYFYWEANIAVYQFSVLILGISDALGGYIGKKWGKKPNICFLQKSILGSLVFFLSTILIFFGFLLYTGIFFNSVFIILQILFFALVVTLLEAVLGKGLDNLFLPIVSGFLLLQFL